MQRSSKRRLTNITAPKLDRDEIWRLECDRFDGIVDHDEQLLIPGLPNSVVADCLIPRLPWYTRPVVRAVSKAWRRALERPETYCALTREAQGREAIGGLIVVHQMKQAGGSNNGAGAAGRATVRRPGSVAGLMRPQCVSILEEGGGNGEADNNCRWRALPPVPGARWPLRVLHDCGAASVGRKVYVMGGWDPCTNAVSADVHVLDIGGGLWRWQRAASMHTAKSLFFCKAVGRKIYAVGGASSHNKPAVDSRQLSDDSGSESDQRRRRPIGSRQLEDSEEDEAEYQGVRSPEPLPEVYDVDRDAWEVLPRVTPSRSFTYTGLAAVSGGRQALAFGYRSVAKGELASFWRVYDPAAGQWRDWEFGGPPCSHVLAGELDLRDGLLTVLDAAHREWRPLEGRLRAGRRADRSACAHRLILALAGCGRVYATICSSGDVLQDPAPASLLSIWRGDIDPKLLRVSWRHIPPPGSLSMCSEMCYLQD